MARKETDEQQHHGFNDIIGIVLLCVSFLMFLALFSYDRADLAVNSVPPNVTKHNWIGPLGAHLANLSFFVLGAAAYILPVLLLGFGLAYLLRLMSYLRRRWFWGIGLLLSCMGVLDLYPGVFGHLKTNLNAPSAGGFIGMTMNSLVFSKCGTVGATIIFATVYVISLLFLTES